MRVRDKDAKRSRATPSAGDSGALSVLFGAGLGISTRGSVTPKGPINDKNFWSDKATAYLSGVSP